VTTETAKLWAQIVTTDNAKSWAQLIGPQLIALRVGAFSAYMTATVTLARLDQRVQTMELKVERLEKRSDQDRETLVRIETKQDIILQKLDRE